MSESLGSLVPSVTALYLDPVRGYIITGDDVGYISLWEVDTLFSGQRASQALALVEAATTGSSARFIHSWRGHQHPVIKLCVSLHTAYTVVSAATDNIVALWWPDGTWAAGLRQGPVVDRQYCIPNAAKTRRAWAVLAFRKILHCDADGSLERAYNHPRGIPPPFMYTSAFRSLVHEALHEADLRVTARAVQLQASAVAALQSSVEEAATRRARLGPTLQEFASRRHKTVKASSPAQLDNRVDVHADSQALRFDAKLQRLIGGAPVEVVRRIMQPEHDTLQEATELHEHARAAAKSTSGVVQALKKAHDAAGVANPAEYVEEGKVVEDPLKYAQRHAFRQRRPVQLIPDRVLAAQASVESIQRAQNDEAQRHLRSKAALSALPASIAPHVRLCCGSVSLGGRESEAPEITVRFPALVFDPSKEAEHARKKKSQREAAEGEGSPQRATTRTPTFEYSALHGGGGARGAGGDDAPQNHSFGQSTSALLLFLDRAGPSSHPVTPLDVPPVRPFTGLQRPDHADTAALLPRRSCMRPQARQCQCRSRRRPAPLQRPSNATRSSVRRHHSCTPVCINHRRLPAAREVRPRRCPPNGPPVKISWSAAAAAARCTLRQQHRATRRRRPNASPRILAASSRCKLHGALRRLRGSSDDSGWRGCWVATHKAQQKAPVLP
jgi:hypothetical protein